jgi:hypothetical protein
VLDAELNSLSNGSKFKGGHRAKSRDFGKILAILLEYEEVLIMP